MLLIVIEKLIKLEITADKIARGILDLNLSEKEPSRIDPIADPTSYKDWMLAIWPSVLPRYELINSGIQRKRE